MVPHEGVTGENDVEPGTDHIVRLDPNDETDSTNI
jgi:hypothetical protein